MLQNYINVFATKSALNKVGCTDIPQRDHCKSIFLTSSRGKPMIRDSCGTVVL